MSRIENYNEEQKLYLLYCIRGVVDTVEEERHHHHHAPKKMLSDSSTAVRLGDDVLQNWKLIGCGGFGAVYRAKQKDWRFDVAIKMLHTNDSERLWKEAKNMARASSNFVLRVFGVYQGFGPNVTTDERVGIVIEFMKRGTLESLLNDLAGPPPWPLAFRLAHQLALGMNFLHTMVPPLLHQDLKPSNVLLDDDLNAKLADFGLSRVTNSILTVETDSRSEKTTGDQEGTIAFIPPEAFQRPYEPLRSFDIYSYGIVLWSILTGKKTIFSLVVLRVPLGDRPPSHEVDCSGVSDLVKLMERCWDGDPDKRPSFRVSSHQVVFAHVSDCLKVTNGVFSRHELVIHNAVHQVLSKLDPVNGFNLTPLSNEEKANFVDNHRAYIIQKVSMAMAITEELGNMVHPETYSQIQAKATNHDKIRVLYSTILHSGGVNVKAAFYDGLETHEPNLLKRMSSNSSP
ncbi:Receptor-interacting serine/threonine-protein kinase 4 [Merluccius polli]|uniref:Receptor-interacting serine/threonine-protein kinase 4 n=1 Tax=Merluccius polli TaxID=89951 RepID=A0AA47N4A4_MERPO|nr:Receptor-interacting serine/threonine-protein kinase 4 [Merluccius polli]